MPSTHTADVPSLFAHLRPPDLPALDVTQPKPLAHERDQVRTLARTIERGAAGAFLNDIVLERAHALAIQQRKNLARRKRSRPDRSPDDSDADDAYLLAEKGFVHKRRTRSASEAAMAQGDEAQEDETGAAEAVKEAHSAAQQRGVRRAKRLRQQLIKPDIKLDDVQLPPDFPSHDLLTSIHTHATDLLTSTHHLVPPLTLSSPRLPQTAVAYFDSLARRAADQEAHLAQEGTLAQYRAIRATRIRTQGAGRRKALWADADRAFGGTALVALGMLAELLVQDAAAAPGDLPDPPVVP